MRSRPQKPRITKVERPWRDDDGRWWLVQFKLAALDGRIECVGVALHPVESERRWGDDLRPLRATTMRQLPFDDVLTRARRDHAARLRLATSLLAAGRLATGGGPDDDTMKMILSPELGEAAESQAQEMGSRPPGRSKHGPGDLVRVARIYQAAFQDGDRAPSKCVQVALRVTPDVARKLVSRCRKNGLLPPAAGTKGRGWLESERETSDEGES
jgi:hypothetical protein